MTVGHFTAQQLARMQATQDSAMQDTCVVQAYTATTDAWGNPSVTYVAGTAVGCGVEHTTPREVQESGDVPIVEAWIRLPLATVVDSKDRISVTYRYAAAITAQVFEVIGPVKRGPSGLRVGCALKVGV